jgi:hypothetical protein
VPLSKVILLSTLLVFSISSAIAQVTSGSVVGVVYDTSGATVSGATITATDTATGAVRTVRSDTSGYYTISSLPPDVYKLTSIAVGFQLTGSTIEIKLSEASRLDIRLALEGTRQTVDVNGSDAADLETEEHQVASLLGAQAIEALPANGRDLFQTLIAGPNVAPFQNAAGPISNFRVTTNSLTIGGSASGTTSYLEDGVTNFSLLTKTANLQPSIESVQEVSLIQNGASARFDQPSVVNVVTKGGTNSFHGRIYDYFRNDALQTVGYFKVPKPPLRYNQFGANIGGPILHNKLFFFFDYAGLRENAGTTLYANVPTQAERGGDFSADNYTIYDPTTYNQDTGTISAFNPEQDSSKPHQRIRATVRELLSVADG